MKLKIFRNTIQGTLWGVLSKLTSMILLFTIRTIIIRIMGAEYAGINSLFTSLLQVLNLAELGFGAAVVFAMYKPVFENDMIKLSAYLNFYRRVYFVIGLIILAAGLLMLPFLKSFISGDAPLEINIYALYLIYLFNTVSSYFFWAYYNSILFAYQRRADSSRIQVIVYFFSYIIQIGILLLTKNFYIFVSLVPITTIIYNFFVYRFVRRSYPRILPIGDISSSEKKDIKKNVVALFVYKVGSTVTDSVDTIVISGFLGLIAVANYNNYLYVSTAVTGLLYVAFNSLTAGIGNRLLQNNIKTIRSDFYFIFSLNALAVIICTTCMFNLYQDFITLWVGERYLLNIEVMSLFCAYFFLHCIRKTVIVYRDAAGMWQDTMFQPLVSSMLNLTLNLILIRYIGIIGILISTCFSMLFIDMPWETRKLFKERLYVSSKRYFVSVFLYTIIVLISCVSSNRIVASCGIEIIPIRMIASLCISIFFGLGLFIIFSIISKDALYTRVLKRSNIFY